MPASLIIHGLAMSTCTQRVLLTAAELDVDIELVNVDFSTGEHKSEAHKKYQPFGAVPYLEDTEAGITFFESRAIARYIATKAGGKGLIPVASDASYLSQLARFENAASVEYCNFDPSAATLVYEKLFKGMFGGGDADPAIVEKLTATLNAKLDAYETILSKQKYLAGDSYTLADLFHLPYGSKLVAIGDGHFFESRPNVARWWKDISSRPASKKILQ